MTSNRAHDLYRRWLDELWSGEPEAAERLASEDFVGHWPGRDTHGPAELAATFAETRAMFSEITFTLEVGPIVEGDLDRRGHNARRHDELLRQRPAAHQERPLRQVLAGIFVRILRRPTRRSVCGRVRRR